MEDEKDIYNLPIAAFTFGKNGQALPYYPIQDLKVFSKEKPSNNNNSIKNNSIESKGSKDSNNNSNDDSEKRFSFKNILKKNTNNVNNNSNNINNNLNMNIINNLSFNNNNFVFIDKEDSNSSYLKIILYCISYMKLLNYYFINELKLNKEESLSGKEKILSIIKDILIKIDQIRNIKKNTNNNLHINNIINIEQLKDSLSNLYKTRKKFLKNAPDDPIDFLYSIINFLHSLTDKKLYNDEVSNNLYCQDCFSHKYLWLKLIKIYECECKSQSKKIINKNNYFIDIPMNILINKFKKNNIYDINQKLFIYYKQIISNTDVKMDCPKYGNECKINKVHYKYILKNFPSYLIFNLDNDYFNNNELFYSLKDILTNFLLIPHILRIDSLFEIEINHKDNNQNYYELIGLTFLKISKVYTCMFKQNGIFNYYEDDIFLNFNNYYEIISFSIKNGLIPVSIFYQNMSLDENNFKNNSIKYDTCYELNKEQILKLEKYVKNANSLNKNLENKIRTTENVISDNYTINYSIGSQNNPTLSDNYNSSRYSGSINSYSSYQKNEYICSHCERINKIENKICFFCGYDNKPIINNKINNNKNKKIKKQKSHNINNDNINNTIQKKISLTQENHTKNQNNELGEIDEEYKNIDPHVLKYFDMPRPYIPKPKNMEKKLSNKQSPILNKGKITFNYNSNIYNINNNSINKNNKLNMASNNNEKIQIKNTYILNNSDTNSIKNNLINNINQNFNLKKQSKVIHKKRISNSENLLKNNYYSEINNNQLNINLKINNNNNYNIFEFGNKKNLNNFEGYGIKEKNLNDKKLLKKINLIKNKNINEFSFNNSNSSGNIEKNNLNFKFAKKNAISNSNNDLNRVNFGIYFPNNNN